MHSKPVDAQKHDAAANQYANQYISINAITRNIKRKAEAFLMALFLKAKRKRMCTKLFSWGGYNGGCDIMIYDCITNTKKNIKIGKPTPKFCEGIVFSN